MVHVPRKTFEETKAMLVRRDERRATRKQKAKLIGTWRPKRKPIKDRIVTLLGLLDKKLHGPLCRLGVLCPKWARLGPHNGEVGYHVIPQQRGDAAKFFPPNVKWCCAASNRGESLNRSLYRDKHVAAFGQQFVEQIESLARTMIEYSDAELQAIERKVIEWLSRSANSVDLLLEVQSGLREFGTRL